MKKLLLAALCLSVMGCAKQPEPEKTVVYC